MEDESFKKGDIVYLTPAAQDFLSRNRGPSFNISVIGRLSTVVEVFDWNTPRGQEILKMRSENPKWSKLVSRDFKYVIVVQYPELKGEGEVKQGLAIPELFPLYHPMAEGKKVPLFRKYPEDMLKSAFALSEELKIEEVAKAVPPKKKVKNATRPNGKSSARKPRKLSRG
jgi:hypothetical protein